jgi:hypothetical protein
MQKIKNIYILVFVCIIACGEPQTAESVVTHSLLVYMIGDNSLSDYCEENIKAISAGIKKTTSKYNSVYVYYDKLDDNPKLLKLYKNKGVVNCETILNYAETNSASATQMAKVINDAFANDKYNSYGLILWSHATGWLPPNFFDGAAVTQSFGRDNGYEMDIKDLSAALPDKFFEYIVFDACNMGAVEVAYQLRNKTEFIISATSEISAYGLPYEKIISMLSDKNRNFKTIASACYDYYINTLETGVALSLVATSEIEELATSVKNIYENHKNEIFVIDSIQHFDRFFANKFFFYDLQDVVKNIATNDELATFQNQLNNVVLFAQSPSTVFRVKIKTYCGLSTYIYGINQNIDNYYQTLDWYKRIGIAFLF